MEDLEDNRSKCVECFELLTENQVHEHFLENHPSYYAMGHTDVAALLEPVKRVEVPIVKNVKTEKKEVDRSDSLSTECCNEEEEREFDIDEFIKVELLEDVKPLIARKLGLLPPGMVTATIKNKSCEETKTAEQNSDFDTLYFKKGKEGFEYELPDVYGPSQLVEFYCFLKSYAEQLKPGERHHIFHFMSELLGSPQTPERETNSNKTPDATVAATYLAQITASCSPVNQEMSETRQEAPFNTSGFSTANASSVPPPIPSKNFPASRHCASQTSEVPQSVPTLQPHFMHTVGGRLSTSHFVHPPNAAQEPLQPQRPQYLPRHGAQAHPMMSHATASIPQTQANRNLAHLQGSANIPPPNTYVNAPIPPSVNTSQHFYNHGNGVGVPIHPYWNPGNNGGTEIMPHPGPVAHAEGTNRLSHPGVRSAATYSQHQSSFIHNAPATFTNSFGNNTISGPVAEDIKPFPLLGVTVEAEVPDMSKCVIKCDLCPTKFFSKAMLLEHQLEVHQTRVNEFCEYCENCGKRYKVPGSKAWEKHQEKCNGEVIRLSTAKDIKGHRQSRKKVWKNAPYAHPQ